MPADRYHQALARAAELWGISPDYWDIWGNRHVTGPDTMRSILRDLGVETGTPEQLERAVAARETREWTCLVPPCVVLSENAHPREVPVHVTAERASETAVITVRREDGATVRISTPLDRAPERGRTGIDGREWVRKAVELPPDLPLGYHEVEVTVGGTRAALRVIVTPDRAYVHPGLGNEGRAAGICVPLYGLRSRRNWGSGDFTDLRALVDWVAAELDASFIALNPLHAIHNRRPFNTSPYLPNSIFYQNFLYLDVERIEDFAACARAVRLRGSAAVEEELAFLRRAEFVEYERVSALKLRFLKLLFASFLRRRRTGDPRAGDFEEYRRREGQLLERFAVYCALDEHLHRRNPDLWVWPDWPQEYRDPESPATVAFRKKHWRSVMFYQYVQWQIDIQLAAAHEYALRAGLSIGLYHDLALATDRFGSDLWAHRPFYAAHCRVGSPPDDFSPKGQDWGFPPPHSDHHRETGYRLFAESIRKNCRHGGALRIDHVMRFFRLYWIPEENDASQGAYVRERYEDLVRILALESVRHGVVLIGEDLGTVEPFVRETLERFGILSYRLLYFEKHPDGRFRRHYEYPAQALVSSTTHDLPTLAGFWSGDDIEARRRAGLLPDEGSYRAQIDTRNSEKQKLLDVLRELGLLPDYVPPHAAEVPALTGELHNAIIGFLALTPSRLLLVNQEDLTKEIAQQNLPGSTWQYPNWSRKMRFTIEQLATDAAPRDFTTMFRNWLERTRRLNSSLRERMPAAD